MLLFNAICNMKRAGWFGWTCMYLYPGMVTLWLKASSQYAGKSLVTAQQGCD